MTDGASTASTAADMRVLVVAPTQRDGEITEHALTQAGLVVRLCSGVGSLGEESRSGAAAVVLTDDVLDGADPVHLANVVRDAPHGDRAQLRALMRFGDEELKHQQLFLQAERVLEESCGHAFGRWFGADPTRLATMTSAIVAHDPLALYLMVLALEWGTQRHYIESVHRDGGPVDPLYVEILKAHWIEEAQHVKVDILEIARLARSRSEQSVARAFEEVLALGAIVDVAFAGQAQQEIETLSAVTGRTFTADEVIVLHETLHRSMHAIMAGVGLGHPSFGKLVRDLSPAGAATIGLS